MNSRNHGLLAASILHLLLLGCLLALGIVDSAEAGSTENLVRRKRIVGGTEAPAPPVDDPVVYVLKEEREARVYGTRDPKIGYYMFRGIRYAEPPVGNRRFQRPVPLYVEGDVNATQWGAPCLQPGPYGSVLGSEDCLFLNVFTPSLPDATDGYPVLIWIHGGGFRLGGATQYEMRNLVDKKTIVVSIQYRLGSLGFLSNSNRDLSGNLGLFDMTLATEWVRNYIEFFGGNTNRIVAFGQGSGASAAFLLGMSNFGRGYYTGIVAMSGSVLSQFAVDRQPRRSYDSVALENSCSSNDTVEMVRCLRQLPASRLIEQDQRREGRAREGGDFVADLSTLANPGPVVEGRNDLRSLPNFVVDEPEDSLSAEKVPDIPLLTGVVKDETGGAVAGPLKDTVTQVMKAIPDYLTKNLVPSLQKIVPVVDDVSQRFVPEAFSKYLSPLEGIAGGKGGQGDGAAGGGGGGQGEGGIAKVTEALNDAIFNVPAFLTVKNWAKKSKAFLYSFDHQSKHGFGKEFLDGLPIVGNTAETGKTSHGDDLGYVFEPNSLSGSPLPKIDFDDEDLQVRDIFTSMIADFARSGNAVVNSKSEDGSFLPLALPSFTGGDDDGFLSITSKPQVSKNFRFCEMGLWTGLAERFKSTACSLLHVDLKEPLKTIEKRFKTISQVPTFPKVANVTDFLDLNKIKKPPIDLPVNIPIVPKIDLPKIDAPKVDLPKIEKPKIEIPKPEAPRVDVPMLPKSPFSKLKPESGSATGSGRTANKDPLSKIFG